MCVCMLRVPTCVLASIDKTRQFEKPGGHKGDWTRTRGTHVNSIGIHISAPLIPISDCFFVMQPPEPAISRQLFAHMRSLKPESRMEIVAPLKFSSDRNLITLAIDAYFSHGDLKIVRDTRKKL